jgi:hypothetical protein
MEKNGLGAARVTGNMKIYKLVVNNYENLCDGAYWNDV